MSLISLGRLYFDRKCKNMKINGEQLGFNFIKDNAVLYNSINCPRERLTLYHYCDFESFLEIISKRTIKFNRIDKVNYLIRNKTIDKLAYDGSRDIRVQIGSIGVNPHMTVEGDRQA